MTSDVRRGFKRKTIIRAITDKTRAWLDSITDEALRERVRTHHFVTGGAIASMLLGELPNDYDIYITDLDVARDIANYYLVKLQEKPTTEGDVEPTNEPSVPVHKVEARIVDDRVRIMIKSAGVLDETGAEGYQYFEQLPPAEMDEYIKRLKAKKGKDFHPALATSNAISLHGGVQIIFRFVGTPDIVHQNFDFIHCLSYYWPRSSGTVFTVEEYGARRPTYPDGLAITPESMEAILARELRYVGSLYPICSMFRIKKFVDRGWTITAGTMLKIAWDISRLQLHIPSVLQDQLIGMDAAYFHQVIRLLMDQGDIDRTYLFEAINRVFDTTEFNTEWMDQ